MRFSSFDSDFDKSKSNVLISTTGSLEGKDITFYVTSVPLCLSQTAHVKIRLPWKKKGGVRLTLTETGAAQVQLQREGDETHSYITPPV